MTKTAVSWVLAGVFAYVWWWLAHRWSYLHSPGNQWSSVFILFTLVSLAVLVRQSRATTAGMFSGLVHAIRGFLPSLPWIALAVVVVRAAAWIHTGSPADPLDHFTHALVAAVLAAVATALWYGAIANASDPR